MVTLNVTRSEARVISQIAARAVVHAANHGVAYPRIDAEMDLTATHANGNPLRLADLLAADDANFAHDIYGILRNLDRKTGTLRNCFVPRFSMPQEDRS